MILCIILGILTFCDELSIRLDVFVYLSVQTSDADPMAKYRAGFITCASEITRMVMGFPGLDENVKFNVMKHLATCCTPDQSPMINDTKVKQEVSHEQIIRQDSRVEPIRNQDCKSEPIRNKDARIESIRSQDVILESIRGQNIRVDPLVSQERPNLIASTVQCIPTESKAVTEKRLMYQQLFGRAGATRRVTSPEARVRQPQYPVNAFEHRTDDQKLQQLTPNSNSVSKYQTILPWSTNNSLSNVSTATLKNNSICSTIPWTNGATLNADSNSNKGSVGYKLPSKVGKSEGSLIKPVPQLPEKFLISGGIRLMPATVLVPVQVGYAPVSDYKHKTQTEEHDRLDDVWRPWERMEQFGGSSKGIQHQGIFSL